MWKEHRNRLRPHTKSIKPVAIGYGKLEIGLAVSTISGRKSLRAGLGCLWRAVRSIDQRINRASVASTPNLMDISLNKAVV